MTWHPGDLNQWFNSLYKRCTQTSYPQEFLHKKEQLMELKKRKSWAWEALMDSYL